MKYVYPAVFEPEGTMFNVDFPDLDGCYTCGDDLTDAMYMAQDVLAAYLCRAEEMNRAIQPPSTLKDIHTEDGSMKTMVMADTDQYRRLNNKKAVKKTLTIPGWLNEAAEARGINFSQVLQDALRAQVGL